MGDDNTNQKKRKSEWTTSYSNMTVAQAEKRLGFRVRSLNSNAIPVDGILANAKDSQGPDVILKTKETKEEVYKQILRYLRIEGFPTEADPSFKEVNINDLVYATISPILDDFIYRTGRNNVQLVREKEVVSTDGEAGGTEEFVVVDQISVEEERFVLIIEAKRSSVGLAMKQCLLAMKDMRDNNGGGTVYGFVTTGESWRMLSYDGAFQLTNKMDVLFDTMGKEKDRWMKDYSAVVDCINVALSSGGIVQKNVVV